MPIFNGDKKAHKGLKAMFKACTGQAIATHECKSLQLQQHLSGEALKAVESLGHSAVAYNAAIARLECKFGREQRKIVLHLREE